MLIFPNVAPVIANTVVPAGSNFAEELLRASSVIYSLASIILNSLIFPELIQPIVPFVQYDSIFREGVPPNKTSNFSDIGTTSHSLLASSINHLRKYTCAKSSRVLFCLVRRSILSSRDDKTSAMAICSGRGGRDISISIIISGVIEGYAVVESSATFDKYSVFSGNVKK